MKNTLFFSYFAMCIALYSNLEAHSTQEQSVIEEFACNSDLFNNILDTCMLDACSSLPDPTYHSSTPRNARAIKKNESVLQKLQNIAIRCYVHMLCRYYTLQKWFLKYKQQQKTASN